MNADEIQYAFRLTAQGRINHPDQVVMFEKLERLFALLDKPETVEVKAVAVDADGMVEVASGFEVSGEELLKAEPGAVIATTKRTRKKAD